MWPETADEFLETYSFWDKEEIYTNGSRLIPQFRVEQMIGHYYLARIDMLEQLCNDLFNHVCAEQIGARVNIQQFVELSERMDDLGLMEEFHEQNNGNR